MPHMIDTRAMGALQAKLAPEFAATAARRFRTGADVQYAFAYFHFLLEGGAREGLDVAAYFGTELDADGDGALSPNELRTLGAVVHRRAPTAAELDELRACLVGPPPAASTTTTTAAAAGAGADAGALETTATTRVETRRRVRWDSLLVCERVTAALAKHARFGPAAQDLGAAAGDEVAFEMVGDDLNKTRDALDAVRAKRPKFICVNDNMRDAAPAVAAELAAFFESYYGAPCPLERAAAAGPNAHAYIAPLRAAAARARAARAAAWLGGGAAAAAAALWAAAAAAEAAERREGGGGGGGAGGGAKAPRTPAGAAAPRARSAARRA